MPEITYSLVAGLICALWILVRAALWVKARRIDWRREAKLLLVLGCLVVIARFTLFAFFRENGRIQPLSFLPDRAWPPLVNFTPLLYLFDYESVADAVLNVAGNALMFVPVGLIWPYVYKELRTPLRALLAGVGFSLLIEVIQLPFYNRTTDIDDLILNTLGFALGFLLYRLLEQKNT